MIITSLAEYLGPRGADGLVTVYDLTVAGTHLYFAGGVLVSNSKRVALLDVNALLAHGATETLRDAGAIRGQSNERLWLQFMQGYNPHRVHVPLRYQKFLATLQAAGINAVSQGHQTHVMALTNKDVDHLAGERVLENGETVHFDKELRPVPGGLFDPKLTGGHGGRQWSRIKLEEALPNPVMEEPIRRILGLTQKQYEGVLAGTEKLPQHGGTGPPAIADALDKINLTREMATARVAVQGNSRTKRDDAVRRLGYLKSAQDLGLHPRDWILNHVPVLPPAFRPVSLMGQSGLPLVSDANYLYRELMTANKNLADMKQELGSEGVGPERLALYHSFKALTGLADPIHPKLQEKGVQGLLKSIFGSSPKFGMIQRKLLSSTVDNVGRAVVAPNPGYHMDEIGIPENQAFDVYSKFIVRRLHRRGMPISRALEQVKDRTDLARETLQQEMTERPVYINRAPVLHKFGIMAFRPHLVKGDVLQTSPLIVSGFGLDYDGDTMQFHVPTSPEAVKEAYERMLPSSNLLSPADFKTPVAAPTKEYLGGLYHASTAQSKRRPHVFRNRQDVIAAYRRGEISADDPVHVLEER